MTLKTNQKKHQIIKTKRNLYSYCCKNDLFILTHNLYYLYIPTKNIYICIIMLMLLERTQAPSSFQRKSNYFTTICMFRFNSNTNNIFFYNNCYYINICENKMSSMMKAEWKQIETPLHIQNKNNMYNILIPTTYNKLFLFIYMHNCYVFTK